MNNWRKERNYRLVKDENGNVTTRIITVYGLDVEVSQEVFEAYSRMDRQRYLNEEQDAHHVVSLDEMRERHMPVEMWRVDFDPGFESAALDQAEDAYTLARIAALLPTLEDDEQDLIRALIFDGVSVREYARRLGVRHGTIEYRRDIALAKLRKNL